MSRRILIALALVMLPAMIVSAQTEQGQAEQTPTEQVKTTPVDLTIEPIICSGVEDNMPVGEAAVFPADVGRVYLWIKITGVTEGETMIHHVWLREGKEMADVTLPVKGSPWRTYSYKTIPPEWAGNWEVKVTGPDGNVIKDLTFTVGDEAKQETQPEKEDEDM